MMNVSVSELRAHLKEYLDRLEKGEEITIIRSSVVIGKILPSETVQKIAEQQSSKPALIYHLDDGRQIRFRRPGSYENSGEIIQLHLDALRAAGALVGDRSELDVDLDNPSEYYEKLGGEFWIGELGGEVVAMGAFKMALESSDGGAELKRMRVQPKLQGKGIGGELLRFLEDRARQAGYESIVLDVTTEDGQAPARHLYEANDYKEFKRQKFQDFENIYYRKKL